ncbi:hypothetical protein D0962_36155 [Leptolyngbyaceae cyanobacterium CCMR0082]|uniref:DUF2281 domain-containing protein n=1 Tax=Adonisia turfae CCMR0082 TaxID=2304604 RepID=A0A6M0SHZ5_9CYAN|nr:hypothetical protein [Adonisia turfae]NEZ68105.1 hypothetical protein [Adonisia turfae CCMR0082]
MTTKELILQELEQLPETLLNAVLDFLISLRPKQPQAAIDKPWMQFVGILDDAEAKEIRDLLNQEFEQFD